MEEGVPDSDYINASYVDVSILIQLELLEQNRLWIFLKVSSLELVFTIPVKCNQMSFLSFENQTVKH